MIFRRPVLSFRFCKQIHPMDDLQEALFSPLSVQLRIPFPAALRRAGAAAVCLQHDDMLLGGVHKLFFPVIEHGAVAAKTQEGTHAFQHLYGQRYACKTVIVIEMREASAHTAHGTESPAVGFKGPVSPEIGLEIVSLQCMGAGLTEGKEAFTAGPRCAGTVPDKLSRRRARSRQ